MHSQQTMDSTAKTLAILTQPAEHLVLTIKDQDFIEQVITEAKKLFVDSDTINQQLERKIYKNPSLKEKIRVDKMRGGFIQYKDDDFISYNANKIEGTNFIAAAGPRHTEIVDFFKNIVFHPTLPTKEIIALGNYLGNEYSDSSQYRVQDFCDYMLDTEFKTITYCNDSEEITVNMDKTSGKFDNQSMGRCFPESIIESQLTLELSKIDSSETKASQKTITKLLPNRKIDGVQITFQQAKCLQFAIQGMTAKKIANELGISFRTVERHFENLKHKLKVKSKVELIEKVINHQSKI